MKQRFQKPLKQWIKAGIWCLIYVLFIAWVGNFWWLLLLPVVFDIFITDFIPWDFWKKTKNKLIYSICSWIDAILFGLIAVYFINLYLFQNYQIPTSSLEKTLLVGDFLFVSKASYGPRIPNTPLSLPLVQHTLPAFLGGGKSYCNKPQWGYKRLKGFDSVERGDIVVFNFPAGDSVATKRPNPDYYTWCHMYGKETVNKRKDIFGEIVYRPVDRRENYVKRCVGVAGDSLQVIDNQIYINGEILPDCEHVQYNYYIQTNGAIIPKRTFEDLGIAEDDRYRLNPHNEDGANEMRAIGMNPSYPVYKLPLTKLAKSKLEKMQNITHIRIEPSWGTGDVYPFAQKTWSRDNYGPVYLPKKGETLTITADNYAIYERVIRNYEHNTIHMKEGVVYINGEATDHYTFKMDYYWMMGDNRHNSADSRSWGFVPEDHIVGRPVVVWLSLDKDKGWFEGKIRWNRFFRSATK